jgi:hypothetical protein
MSDRISICLPDGRWLSMTREVFNQALADGQSLCARPAPPKPLNDAPLLVSAEELARLTSTAPSWWEAAARDLDCPALMVGNRRRFKVADCLSWLEQMQERDGAGRIRGCAAAPRARA